MKKFLLCISASAFGLCLTIYSVRAMDIDDSRYERRITISEYREYSEYSYNQGNKAENLWEKRKYYLHAFRASEQISKNFPALWNQDDSKHYTLIKNTIAYYAGTLRMEGEEN